MNDKKRGAILLGVTATVFIAVFLFVPPIAQPLSYHQFVDDRTIAGIPRALDVLSNIGFLIVGFLGLNCLLANKLERVFTRPAERWSYIILFVGVALTCFGSGFYHLAPDNARLVWDRLPMTIGFMGLMSAIICERISLKIGLAMMPVLLLLGAFSVSYWQWTEIHGTGDLRLYLLVQFFPALAIPLIMWLYPARYTGNRELGFAALLYVAAKILEAADKPVYEFTRQLVSGHTLKHLAAAWGVWWILQMLQVRHVRGTLPATERASAVPAT
ncbi:MAG: hypothetical protein JWN45_2121 [Acidobacteriaceae bacterium]|nr:hypothetical protein [Acidobacteriaceae bacterium]